MLRCLRSAGGGTLGELCPSFHWHNEDPLDCSVVTLSGMDTGLGVCACDFL